MLAYLWMAAINRKVRADSTTVAIASTILPYTKVYLSQVLIFNIFFYANSLTEYYVYLAEVKKS